MNPLVRQIHRWLSMAFTAGFIANSVVIATAKGEPAFWVYLLALIPLFGLFGTGLYLFVLPYLTKARGAA